NVPICVVLKENKYIVIYETIKDIDIYNNFPFFIKDYHRYFSNIKEYIRYKFVIKFKKIRNEKSS
ncbi:MAG: hypothetical protein KDH96_12520, partial [Candidatus Riesia sp.]|nr:hypothetical protein [Candidatus Riesia sp.]